ncbi:hypothetical protein AaE_013432 [Aphanomyces astaci]|uniref:Uncharacterized protein n=1 Tax=Aphanomyces astaci TaxID=112090 RepID=A0A6A4ZAD8_APHAT|nr:hypothetical protein AaE_013432 [Aphanomyces astaci]
MYKVDGSQTLDNSFVADDSDDNDAKDGEQPGNDPDSDEYWAKNDVEDPGRTDADAAVGGKANKRPDVPRVFPTPEKRLTPRKDFSSIYMDAQIQVNVLEREKFEYQKECDRTTYFCEHFQVDIRGDFINMYKVDGSQTLDNSFVADDSDDNDAKDGEQPGNDPDSDEYWAKNDVEDPGRTDADAAVGGKANKRPDVPRVFPTPEKRLTPRKDFSSIYMDAQIQVNVLEREKFEYQKECDRVIHAAAASQQLQCAKASMIEKLVGSGIVDVENIRELVAIAFPAE